MNERPILFSAPMVRAILAGAKTQTRRVVAAGNSLVNGSAPCMKRDPSILGAWCSLDFSGAFVDRGPSPAGNPGPYLKVPGGDGSVHRVYSRIQPGDRLWVKETWRAVERQSDMVDGILFRADDAFVPIENTPQAAEAWGEARRDGDQWRPSIFMPHWASRVTLEVTGVRVERVQDIREEDACAEGLARIISGLWVSDPDSDRACPRNSAREAFADLWQSINGKRPGYSWEASPWVWCVQFKRLERGGVA